MSTLETAARDYARIKHDVIIDTFKCLKEEFKEHTYYC